MEMRIARLFVLAFDALAIGLDCILYVQHLLDEVKGYQQLFALEKLFTHGEKHVLSYGRRYIHR